MTRFTQLPYDQQPRTVLRFAEEKSLLISGMMSGGAALAGKPAVVSIPRGKGNFLMFSINPMWRQQTQGSFMLLLNAAMNFEYLNSGRTPPKNTAATDVTSADFDDVNYDHQQ
jgi:hypothetical protein